MHIIYTRPDDGGCSVVNPASWERLVRAVTTPGAASPTPLNPPRPLWAVLGGKASAADIAAAKVEWAETEDEFMARIAAKDVPPGATDIAIVDDTPADLHFRNAWKADNGRIVIDMRKARDIHRDRMRLARAPKLAALDIEYQRADELGDARAKADVAARKQALRDVTADPAIEAATTPEELRAVWPDALR